MTRDCIDLSFQLSGPLLALVLAAGQVVVRDRNASHNFYALTFFSIFLWSGVLVITGPDPSSGRDAAGIALEIVFRTSYSLTSVFLYFLMQSIFNPGFSFNRRNSLLFLPAVLTLPLLLAAAFFSGKAYEVAARALSYLLYSFSVIVYLLIIRQIGGLRKLSTESGSRKSLLKIMFLLAIAAILTIIPQLACAGFRDNYSVPVLIVLFYLVTMRYPEFFILLREEAGRARYVKSKIGGLDVKKVMESVESAMSRDRLFLKSDLTLRELADLSGVTAHQLSEILNVCYKKNFHDFINRYRIEEAKRIFMSDRDMTAIGICYAAGFNSNSAFYRAFRKETGVSPARFRGSI